MLNDIVRRDEQGEVDTESLLRQATEGLSIGSFADGNPLLLREAFNKVIHATDTQLGWTQEEGFDWWSGLVNLSGYYKKQDWSVKLDVESYSVAANRLLDSIADKVDWYHFYKYDR